MTLRRVDGVRWGRLRVDGVDRWRAVASASTMRAAAVERERVRHRRGIESAYAIDAGERRMTVRKNAGPRSCP